MKLVDIFLSSILLVLVLPSSHNTLARRNAQLDSLHTSFADSKTASVARRDAGLARSKRSRRSTDSGEIVGDVCKKSPDQDTQIKTNMYVFEKEINPSITMSWLGKDENGESPIMLLLTTYEATVLFLKLVRPSVLYRSTDYGKTFTKANEEIYNKQIRKEYGVLKSPINPNRVILLSENPTTQQALLLVSKDAGKSFTDVSLSFNVIGPLLFHPYNEDWILAKGKEYKQGLHSAYLSTDFGKTWKHLRSNVDSVKWGAKTDKFKTEKEISTILLTTILHGTLLSYNTNLYRSRDLGVHFELIAREVYSFGIQGPFLFISIDLDKDLRTRIMHVSSDGGDTFEEVQAPSVTLETFYSIVETVDGMVFLHVDEPGDTGKGTLYTSDADGIIFSSSLKSHLYTNFDGVTDFYKVESMRGTYMTQRMNGEDSSVTTVITHDRGGVWDRMKLTAEQCKAEGVDADCSLHMHGKFSKTKGINVQGPLSEASAPGLILLHGNAGKALKSKFDVWLSEDGGYAWKKVLKGPHLYGFGDSGKAVIAIPSKDGGSNNYFLYSTDFGQCWFRQNFTDIEGVVIGGLTTEPGAKTLRFSLWGHKPQEENKNSKEWVVFTVEFDHLLPRKCGNDDFVEWHPHAVDGKDGCLLGYKETLKRPKKDSFCSVGHIELLKTEERCTCSNIDFECDYGFYRKLGEEKCIKNPKITNKVCLRGTKEVIKDEDEGYRLIPGDKCKDGPPHLVKYVNTAEKCGESYTHGIVEFQTHPAAKTVKARHAVAAAICIPILILALLVGGYFVKKHYDSKRNRPMYSYSQLMQDEEEDDLGGAAFNSRPKGLGTYHDDSDSDDAAIIDL